MEIPGKEGHEEFSFVMAIVDGFTKLVKFVNMKSKSAEACADAILKEWCLVYGFPLVIASDRDPSFMGQLVQHLCTAMGSKSLATTTYHPNCNGQVEIFFKSLGKFLRVMIANELDQWPLMTRFCEFHLNTSVNQSTQCTPYQMVYGNQARMNCDLIFPVSSRIKIPKVHCSSEYVQWVQRQLRRVHQFARQTLKKSVQRMKKQYDSKFVKPPPIQSYAYRHIPPWNKMTCQFQGPGKVIEQISDQHILWQESPDKPIIKLNLKNVKPYVSSRIPANWKETTRPDLLEEDLESPEEDEESQDDNDEESSQESTEEEIEEQQLNPQRRSQRISRPVNRLDL